MCPEINDWSSVAANNNSAPPDGAPEGMAPSGVNNTMRENMAVLKRAYADSNASVTAGGTVDAITVAANQTLTAYYDGLIIGFEAAGTNTGAITINVDGLGAVNLKKQANVAMSAGEVISGQKVVVIHDGTNFQIASAYLDASTAADAAQTAADVLLTNADVVSTNADAAQTAADVTTFTGTASTTSLLIEVASKAFTIASGLSFQVGDFLLITSDADEANYMHGQITSYASTTLTVNVTNVGGSGTLADWTIRRSGTRGSIGPTGPAGSGDMIGANNLSDVDSAPTSFGNIKQTATTSATGVVEIATQTEVDTGSDSSRSITPETLTGFSGLSGAGGHISGLKTSNDTDADHDVLIATGQCRDDGDSVNIVLSVAIAKQIDAAWSVGDDAGGLDTGSVGNNTGYGVWLIRRSDTGVVDALFSASFTSPTMPTNYDEKRLIGWVRTDSSANILSFLQSGDYFRLMTRSGDQDINDSSLTTDVFETATLTTPPLCLADINAELNNTSAADAVSLRYVIKTSGADDGFASGEFSQRLQTAANGDIIATQMQVLTDSASQVQYGAKFSSGTPQFIVKILGCLMLTRSDPT